MSTPDATATTTSMDTFTHFDKRFSLEKLTDDGTTNTYGSWVGVAKSKLQLLNLWKYISGPESVAPVIPKLVADTRFEATEESSGEKKWFIQKGNKDEVEEATKKAEPWARGNLAARTVLLEALSPEKRSLISEDDSAKFIWEFLAEEYRPLNFARSQVQFQNIMKFTCKPGMDVWKWCEKLRELYVELRNHSPTRIKDTDFAVTIANLLPATPGWAEFGGRLFDALTKAENEGKPLSSAAVFAMVRNYDWAQKKNDPQVAAEAYNTDALYPDSKRPGSPIANQTSSKRAKPSNSKDQDYCENPKIQPNNLYHLHVQPISRNLAGRIEANHASLADRISSAPLIDRISPHPISAATSVPMQKPQNEPWYKVCTMHYFRQYYGG
ncbi:hypothetical protein BC629DRAFT_1604338 [Irpex lacteus]|nr:hypothetical protein BC629DRAFT_1604338 [Irpex lacteus]